jgi:putative spermidine/putrescine transport system ATP-binding protein
VTHDQEEALSIADRVGVMREGSLQQLAKPEELYYRPETAYVAEFVGLTNAIPGEVQAGKVSILNQQIDTLPGSITSGNGLALVRTESLHVIPNTSGESKVLVFSFLGSNCRVQVQLPNGSTVIAQVSNELVSSLSPGSLVDVKVASNAVFVK